MQTPFAVLLACVLSSAAIAQDSSRVATDSTAPKEQLYRDPHKALVLGSIFPGAGYFYAGQFLKGYGTAWVTAFGLAMGPLIYQMDSCGLDFTCTSHKVSWGNRAAGIMLIGAGLWSWISSARDAPKAAERANEQHRRRELKADPLVDISPQGVAQLKAGLSIGW